MPAKRLWAEQMACRRMFRGLCANISSCRRPMPGCCCLGNGNSDKSQMPSLCQCQALCPVPLTYRATEHMPHAERAQRACKTYTHVYSVLYGPLSWQGYVSRESSWHELHVSICLQWVQPIAELVQCQLQVLESLRMTAFFSWHCVNLGACLGKLLENVLSSGSSFCLNKNYTSF